jgi:hypothetical protein
VFGTFVCKIHDFALRRSVDRAVRLIYKTFEFFGMPMVAPRLLFITVHAIPSGTQIRFLYKPSKKLRKKLETFRECYFGSRLQLKASGVE